MIRAILTCAALALLPPANAAPVVIVPRVVVVPRPAPAPARPAPAKPAATPEPVRAAPAPIIVPPVARPACSEERRKRQEC